MKNKVIKKISIFFFLFSVAVLFKAFLLDYYPDFTVHYYGFKLILENQNPYLIKGQMFVPHVYPPFVIMLFSPFIFLPFFIAQKIWLFLSILFLYLSIYLLFKLNNKKINSSLGFFILGMSFLYFPVRFTMGMGQINSLILFLIVLFIFFLKKKNFASSFFLALSLAMKFFPLLILPYLLVVKKRKIFIYSIVLFIFFTILGIIFFGTDLNFYFYNKIFPSLLNSWKSDYYNQSLLGFISRIVINLELKNILRIVGVLLFIIIAFASILKANYRKENKFLIEVSLLIITTIIVNNFSWQHHYLLMLFAFINILFNMLNRKLSCRYYLILGISYLLTTLNFNNPDSYHILLQSHVFYGAIILWVLNIKLLIVK